MHGYSTLHRYQIVFEGDSKHSPKKFKLELPATATGLTAAPFHRWVMGILMTKQTVRELLQELGTVRLRVARPALGNEAVAAVADGAVYPRVPARGPLPGDVDLVVARAAGSRGHIGLIADFLRRMYRVAFPGATGELLPLEMRLMAVAAGRADSVRLLIVAVQARQLAVRAGMHLQLLQDRGMTDDTGAGDFLRYPHRPGYLMGI